MHEIGFFIVPGNAKITSIDEHLAQLIADQIYNGLEIQLGGESLLDGVDDLQLGDAFLLRFKESCVLDGDSHVGGEGLQEAQVIVIEEVLLVITNANHAQNFVADNDGYHHC